MQASDGNANDALTYELADGPGRRDAESGAVDRLGADDRPSAGRHTFTARVTDANGNGDDHPFQVDVVHVNKPPQLGAPGEPDPCRSAPRSARTLTASDPDAGDALTFALVAGPAGMTLSGADLNWSTAGTQPGRLRRHGEGDRPAGSFDQKTFTVTLQQAAPAPVAVDDSLRGAGRRNAHRFRAGGARQRL